MVPCKMSLGKGCITSKHLFSHPKILSCLIWGYDGTVAPGSENSLPERLCCGAWLPAGPLSRRTVPAKCLLVEPCLTSGLGELVGGSGWIRHQRGKAKAEETPWTIRAAPGVRPPNTGTLRWSWWWTCADTLCKSGWRPWIPRVGGQSWETLGGNSGGIKGVVSLHVKGGNGKRRSCSFKRSVAACPEPLWPTLNLGVLIVARRSLSLTCFSSQWKSRLFPCLVLLARLQASGWKCGGLEYLISYETLLLFLWVYTVAIDWMD